MSEIKKKSKRLIEGDILEVPFVEDYHTYARVLHYGDYAFYDCKTANAESKSPEEVIQSEILFTALVNDNVFRKNGWNVLGNIPLESHLVQFSARYFNTVATDETNITFYKIYKEEILQAIENDWIHGGKIQMGGIHDPIHIYERLKAFYEGKKYSANDYEMQAFYRDCKFMGVEL